MFENGGRLNGRLEFIRILNSTSSKLKATKTRPIAAAEMRPPATV